MMRNQTLKSWRSAEPWLLGSMMLALVTLASIWLVRGPASTVLVDLIAIVLLIALLAARQIGIHGGWCGLRQGDDTSAHYREARCRQGQHGGARGEALPEQPQAQDDADDRIDDHEEGLGGCQRPDVQRRLHQEQGRHAAHG